MSCDLNSVVLEVKRVLAKKVYAHLNGKDNVQVDKYVANMIKASTSVGSDSVAIDEAKLIAAVASRLGNSKLDKLKDKYDSMAGTLPKKSNTPYFDKLPRHNPNTKTMTYAGIGSRKAPPEILKAMTEVAKELETAGFKLQTGRTFGGKEEGSDKAFSDGTTSANKTLFGPEEATRNLKKIAKEIHANPGSLNDGALKLMARNAYQVFGTNLDTPVDFVLAWTPLNKKNEVVTHADQRYYGGKDNPNNTGGTGQAIAYASLKGIPVINMADPKWRDKLDTIVNALHEKPTKPKGETNLQETDIAAKIEEVLKEMYPDITVVKNTSGEITKEDDQSSEKGKTINIYAGTRENPELSNFANRPFESNKSTRVSISDFYTQENDSRKPITWPSVESAYQAEKIRYSPAYWEIKDGKRVLNAKGLDLLSKLSKARGSEAKTIGKNIEDLEDDRWVLVSSKVMEALLYDSFSSNPKAKKLLLDTGDAILTHTQAKGKWKKEFPRLLMEVRDKLIKEDEVPFQKDKDGKVKGSYNKEERTIAINTLLSTPDTLPHEYAHHYIEMYRDTDIVKTAIDKWGTEEELVQAIGEEVVEGRGEALTWWNTFKNFILTEVNKLTNKDKNELRDILTYGMMNNLDLKNEAEVEKHIKDKSSKLDLSTDKSNRSVVVIEDALTTIELDQTKKNMEVLFEDTTIDKVHNKEGHTAIAFGPVDYTYGSSTHKAKETPKIITDLALLADKGLGHADGYFNHVLINKFEGGSVDIGTHQDAEKIYKEEDGSVGAVGILSIGDTVGKHRFGTSYWNEKDRKSSDTKGQVSAGNNSLVEMSSGDIHHYVGGSKGVRYSITFRHIPESNITKKPTPDKGADGYMLQGGAFPASLSQVELIDAIKDRTLNISKSTRDLPIKDRLSIVQGMGGTGKSTSIGTAITEALSEGVNLIAYGATPTHTAKGVLIDMAKYIPDESVAGITTIASLLRGIAITEAEHKLLPNNKAGFFRKDKLTGLYVQSEGNYGFIPENAERTEPTVLVIDEVSMMEDEEMLGLIAVMNTLPKLQVVLMGDYHQLTPVNNSKSPMLDALILNEGILPKFTDNELDVHEIKEQHRQNIDSALYTVISNAASKVEDQVGNNKGNFVTNDFTDGIDSSDEVTFINDTIVPTGANYSENTWNTILSKFSDTTVGTKFIAFNNATLLKFNKAFRPKMFGKEAITQPFIAKKDTLLLYNSGKFMTDKGEPATNETVTNGMHMSLDSVETIKDSGKEPELQGHYAVVSREFASKNRVNHYGFKFKPGLKMYKLNVTTDGVGYSIRKGVVKHAVENMGFKEGTKEHDEYVEKELLRLRQKVIYIPVTMMSDIEKQIQAGGPIEGAYNKALFNYIDVYKMSSARTSVMSTDEKVNLTHTKMSTLLGDARVLSRGITMMAFNYAYALTTYKAQGQTIKNVIFEVGARRGSGKVNKMVEAMDRYTAVSRAKETLTVIGNSDHLAAFGYTGKGGTKPKGSVKDIPVTTANVNSSKYMDEVRKSHKNGTSKEVTTGIGGDELITLYDEYYRKKEEGIANKEDAKDIDTNLDKVTHELDNDILSLDKELGRVFTMYETSYTQKIKNYSDWAGMLPEAVEEQKKSVTKFTSELRALGSINGKEKEYNEMIALFNDKKTRSEGANNLIAIAKRIDINERLKKANSIEELVATYKELSKEYNTAISNIALFVEGQATGSISLSSAAARIYKNSLDGNHLNNEFVDTKTYKRAYLEEYLQLRALAALKDRLQDNTLGTSEQALVKGKTGRVTVTSDSTKWTRKSVEADKDTVYVYAENGKQTSGGNKITEGPLKNNYYPNSTTAVVRGLPNTIPLFTIQKADGKSHYEDSDLAKNLATTIEKIKKALKDGKEVKLANGYGTGAAKLRDAQINLIHKELNKALNTEYPIETRKITLDGNAIPYAMQPFLEGKPLAATQTKGKVIFISEGLTVDKVEKYLKSEDKDSTRSQVLRKMDERGIKFNDILEALSKVNGDQGIREFLLLHEYKHAQQIHEYEANKRKKEEEGEIATSSFKRDWYDKDPVFYELDADIYALNVLYRRYANSSIRLPKLQEGALNAPDSPQMSADEKLLKELSKIDTAKVKNYSLKPWNSLPVGKNGSRSTKALYVMRISKTQALTSKKVGLTEINNFGNPFATYYNSKYPFDDEGITFNTANGDNNKATIQYYNWLNKGKIPTAYKGNETNLSERREFILNNLDTVRGASKLHYTGTAKDSPISHVNALIKIANDKGQQTITNTLGEKVLNAKGTNEDIADLFSEEGKQFVSGNGRSLLTGDTVGTNDIIEAAINMEEGC